MTQRPLPKVNAPIGSKERSRQHYMRKRERWRQARQREFEHAFRQRLRPVVDRAMHEVFFGTAPADSPQGEGLIPRTQ